MDRLFGCHHGLFATPCPGGCHNQMPTSGNPEAEEKMRLEAIRALYVAEQRSTLSLQELANPDVAELVRYNNSPPMWLAWGLRG